MLESASGPKNGFTNLRTFQISLMKMRVYYKTIIKQGPIGERSKWETCSKLPIKKYFDSLLGSVVVKVRFVHQLYFQRGYS